MQATAGILQRRHEGCAVRASSGRGLACDREEVRDIHFAPATGAFEHIESVNFGGSGGGEGGGGFRGSGLLSGHRRAGDRHQSRAGVVFFQPLAVVLDLREVGINRPRCRALVAEQGDANVEREFLSDENRPRMPDQKIDRVMHRAARGIFDRHQSQRGRSGKNALENPVNCRAGDEIGFRAKTPPGEDPGESSLRSEIGHTIHIPASNHKSPPARKPRCFFQKNLRLDEKHHCNPRCSC